MLRTNGAADDGDQGVYEVGAMEARALRRSLHG
jgi:hypothetical protein